ncbi:hypothetical protein [Haloactinopolyspora sp.]|uniref:hypothetical protein n=1 Tax=Haloactinopolyspora sp. TaxID=1966353 RepID=UPI00261F2485|nr:hypothetical protein [Haloactinopolyspora sp.]
MTTAFAAVDALVTLIEGAMPADVTVVDGYPGPNVPDQIVAVGGTPGPIITWHSAPAELGSNRREENYTIACVASVATGGEADQERAARDALATIVAAIEAAIYANPTLSGTVRYAQIVHGLFTGTNATTATRGRMWTLVFNVECTARV